MNSTPDAAESNAGDDFHVLWAARRALTLLTPSTLLRGIRPEGPPPEEAKQVDPTGDKLLGIDLTEYYEGTDFATATSVVFSQLKYSTRRSSEAWTAARLAQGKGATRRGSVIFRMADCFKTYIHQYGRAVVLHKLKISLVSNKACDENLLSALAAAQLILKSKPDGLIFSHLSRLLAPEQRDALTALRSGVNQMASRSFCDLLRVLDLSGCSEACRLDQEIALLLAIAKHGSPEVSRQYKELKDLIFRRMMPEARRQGIVTVDDVCVALGVGSREYLFPATSRIETLHKLVDRACVPQIAQSIANSKNCVCLHGSAGIGKSTIAQSLRTHFPNGSVTIVFDCYGGGSYLDPAEIRHKHSRAITQIANDLATSIGSQLLLFPDQSDEDLLRSFVSRLQIASKLVREDAPDALVVVIIDAADNSVTAAQSRNEKTFVHEIVRCRVPDGCRLVVTARTHRVDQLRLPPSAEFIEIPSFSLQETSAHLGVHASCSGGDETQQFHEMTGGIPRVQRYAIEGSDGSFANAMEVLLPKGQTVASIIDSQLQEVGKKIGSDAAVRRFCAAAILLPRPIPVASLAAIIGEQEAAIQDFCVDLCHGFTFINGHLGFRDEDFENHLRDRFGDSPQELLDSSINWFSKNVTSNPYAAAHIVDLLHAIGRHDEIVALVYSEREPAAILDPIERKEAFARRARFALSTVVQNGDRTELLKLLFVVAQATKSDRSVEHLLLDHADLACQLGDPATIQRLYLHDKNNRIGWYGPIHLQCAAHFSRQASTIPTARSHLRSGESWIDWWSEFDVEDHKRPHLDSNAVANGAEAVLRIYGQVRCKAWLGKWGPPAFVLTCIHSLARQIVSADGKLAFMQIQTNGLRADALTLITDAAMSQSILPPRPLIERAVAVWIRSQRRVKLDSNKLSIAGLSLCEAAAAYRFPDAVILILLNLFTFPPPQHSHLSGEEWDNSLAPFLRHRCLRARLRGIEIKPDDERLLPESLRKKSPPNSKVDKERWDKSRADFREHFSALIPTYDFRADVLLGRISDEAVTTAINELLVGLHASRFQGDGYEHQSRLKLKADALVDSVIRLTPDAAQAFLRAIVDRCIEGRWIWIILSVAEMVSYNASLHTYALQLTSEAQVLIQLGSMASSERVNLFVQCCRIANRVDPSAGRFYFQLAIEAASEIDSEALPLLRLVSELSMKSIEDSPLPNGPSLAETFATFVEDCYWRLGGGEHFPWNQCIQGITGLAPLVGTSALCRWDQRGIVRTCDHVDSLVAGLRAAHACASSTVIASIFLWTLGDDDTLSQVWTVLEELQARDPSMFEKSLACVADYVLRLAPLDNRHSLRDELLEWGRKHGCENHKVFKTLHRVDSLRSLGSTPRHLQDSITEAASATKSGLHDEQWPPTPTVDWDQILAELDQSDAGEIERRLLAFQPTGDRLQASWELRQHYREFFHRSLHAVPPASYVDNLNAIVAISSSFLGLWDLEEILGERLREWSFHPLVREWKVSLASRLVKRSFLSFWADDQFSEYTLNRLNKTLGLSSQELIEAITASLADNIRDVPAAGLYDFAVSLLPTLDADGARIVLNFVVPELERQIQKRDFTVIGTGKIRLSTQSASLEAALLWHLFGHPDKRVRWQALHTARAAIQLGNLDLVGALAEWLSCGRGHPFNIPRTTFYWLAARQWFFLLVDWLSKGHPSSLHCIKHLILAELIEPREPHAVVMRLAKRVAQRLIVHDESVFSADERAAISAALVSPFPYIKERLRSLGYDDYCTDSRFDFDHTDTQRYWFRQVGELFGIKCGKFILKAERWICDTWHADPSVFKNELEGQWKRREREWGLFSNGHGSTPVIEDLRTYFEFNSMQCVAAELIKSHRLVASSWREDPWDGWLKQWDLIRKEGWIADRREHPPLELRFWAVPSEKCWDKVPTSDDFDRAVGFQSPLHEGMFVAWGNDTVYSHEGYEERRVYTALVSESSAVSLMYALQYSEDPRDFRIPCQNDELEIDCSIVGQPFLLKGWVKVRERDASGIDEDDPFRYSLGATLIEPGRLLVDSFNLVLRSNGHKEFRNRDTGRLVARCERWDDVRRERDNYGFRTEGHRLWISVSDTLAFLRRINCSLIVESQSVRSIKQYGSRTAKDKYDVRSRIYVIDSTGTVETIEGRHCPWEKTD